MSLPIPTTLPSQPSNPPSPPEDPPGTRRTSYGLLETPKRAVLHSNESIVCGTVVLTKGMPPAYSRPSSNQAVSEEVGSESSKEVQKHRRTWRIRETRGASFGAGWWRLYVKPIVVS